MSKNVLYMYFLFPISYKVSALGIPSLSPSSLLISATAVPDKDVMSKHVASENEIYIQNDPQA